MACPLSNAETLLNIAYHVFLPPQLPQQAPCDDHEQQINRRLALLAHDAIENYRSLVVDDSGQWAGMSRMLSRLAQTVETPFTQHRLQDDMSQMQADDVIALHIHQQNAAVLVRKSATTTTFEIFEVQAPNESVMSVPGKLVRHFPGPAIQIPNSTANDSGFIEEISNFLSRMNIDILEDAMAKTTKAGSKVAEVRDSADPHYISQLFTGILRGFGQEVEPRRIIKRIADEVLWNNTYLPWCRSPIWLIVRVALQTSLESADDYKNFMAYFHAYLLGLCCVEDSFPDDLLSTMRAKMARRLLKVQGFVPACVVEAAKAASGQTEKILRGRWNAIQADIPRFQPLTLDTDQAVAQSLPNSRTYLSEVIQGRSGRNKNSSFNPNHRPRLSGRPDFAEFANGALTTAFNDNKHIALFDFEHAVHNHLPTWVDNNRNQPTSCATIFSCFEQYISAALSYYTHDVADRSIMILTVMELWVALDRVATSQHGLLLEYSPEIPEDLIEVLLLRSSLHLERANMVQSYLRRRHADGETAGRGSVFTSKATSNSLPVRFFQQSRSLQVLKQDIEREARRQRQEKIEELHRLNAEHARLMTSISQSSCDTFVDRWGNRAHDRWCTKCSKADQAKKMRILLHEWPLPSNELDASAVVFELECPEALNLWRSATYKILCDLAGSFRDGKASPHCTLAGYDGLTKWSYPLRSSDHRITIASSTKSFLDSHYSPTSIPALESTVCVNNGLTFALFDSTDDAWAAGPFTEASVAKYGTFTLPSDSPYRYLQPALKGTSHTSNQILADQSDCPKDLSLHEHYAYGTLRSGPRLQWMNIARGLEENSLTFSSEEVDLLHTQAAWQIGRLSRDSQARGWHLELADSQFGYLLVTQALRVLDCVRANWLEATSVRTIVMLVTRLLSSTTDSNTQFEAYRFLREARAVTYGWLGELSTKLQDAELESQVLDYQQRVCEMAAICRSTYDVDAPHLPGLLLNQEDCLALVSCSVALYDNQPPQLEKAPRHLRALLSRDRRLAHKVLPFMLEKIRDMPRLLDDSVSRYWDGYCPGSGDWEALPAPNSRWVRTTTAATSTEVSQQVHLNLLKGLLLVDGKPLGRLPRNYVTHPTYIRLFGQKVLNVVPAKSPGMVFSTRTHVDGNQVLFCLEENSGELIVRSRRNRATFQLIPHSELAKDFPRFFSSDYHHWIDLETGLVEFRPLAAPWSSDDKNWHLEFSASSASCMRQIGEQGSILLADMHSRFFKDVACQIDPLEDPQYLHITQCSRDPARITVELPRMKLAFFINEDRRLESSNLSGQVIDEAQSSGTMLGLVNQLVLRPRDSTAKSFPQSNVVLIPSGKVDFRLQNHHARVTINRGSGRHVNFYQYKVDMDLGYLTSNNTSLTSRLFKIYLHAVTSHCLPDPLTGRTGTEEALHELSEAATSSFDQINQEQARLLQLIGALTPQRVYYPANLKSMQTTKWIDIPCLAQHYAFCTAVNTILERARSLQLFNPLTFDLDPYITEFDTNLLKRTAHRTRIYYPSDVTARLSTILGESEDRSCWYEGRDHQSNGWTEKGQLASWASGLVHDRWGKPT
ncbi:hypothetical protein FS749_011921 [Ceratobasidium sp. UAMH 11750]|nr:hypothetical protein FS749_011921 [Ceratobasidium sp. UAMH 11750]